MVVYSPNERVVVVVQKTRCGGRDLRGSWAVPGGRPDWAGSRDPAHHQTLPGLDVPCTLTSPSPPTPSGARPIFNLNPSITLFRCVKPATIAISPAPHNARCIKLTQESQSRNLLHSFRASHEQLFAPHRAPVPDATLSLSRLPATPCNRISNRINRIRWLPPGSTSSHHARH